MILTFIETENGLIKKSSFTAASYCYELKEKFNYAVIGVISNKIEETETKKLNDFGISKLYKVDNGCQNQFDSISRCIADIVKKESVKIIILSDTYNSKYILPMLTANLNYSSISNAIEVPKSISPFLIKRNAFSGKAFENAECTDQNIIISVNTSIYKSKYNNNNNNNFEIVNYNTQYNNDIDFEIVDVQKEINKINLRDAEIVVSGGRGLKGPENWKMIEELAAILKGATACSKPVSDLKWRPHEEHVGQTGKTISPELYIAIGISGAIQHAAGISSSKCILSINTDSEAPIFKISNYGIIGDAFEVVPQIIEELKK